MADTTTSSLIDKHLLFLRNTALGLPNGPNFVSNMEKKTNFAVEHMLCGIEVLLIIFLFCGLAASVITNLVGFIFPAIASIMAIESKEKKDDTEWLVYWVIFATLNLLDPFVEHVLIYWIPFFYPLKVSFLLWMMLPSTKGANTIFRKAAPLLRQLFRESS